MTRRYDVAIIGAGFAGSILAWILARQGRSVALIDAETHPRFAIGESSTPIADLLLRRLGQQHGLGDLVSLSTYGSWRADHAELSCGLKRGFSYYVHHPGKEFSERDDHNHSLVVAASANDAVADTHWFRAETDRFLFQRAISAGVGDWTGHRVEVRPRQPEHRLLLTRNGNESSELESDWVVDASGRSAVLARLAGAADRVSELKTCTYSVFAHYANVGRWTPHLQRLGLDRGDDPFDPDDAAQHHLLGEGWLWMLRFNNGITSVGLTSPSKQPTLDWSRYPSLAGLFQEAFVVAPPGGPSSSGRIQGFFDPVIDERRLMLPTAAATIDPLHSTGIAHALAGVDRVANIILGDDDQGRRKLTEQYRGAVVQEAKVLDRIVHAAYQTMNDFPRFVAACMLYFAGAIRCEERYGEGEFPAQLWNTDDASFVQVLSQSCDRLLSSEPTERVIGEIRRAIEPWNTAGLLDPSANHRYAYTATKR